jgi:hypothetical protein
MKRGKKKQKQLKKNKILMLVTKDHAQVFMNFYVVAVVYLVKMKPLMEIKKKAIIKQVLFMFHLLIMIANLILNQ